MNSGAADPGSGLCLENKVGRGTISDLDIILAPHDRPTLRIGRDRDHKAGQAPAISRHLLKHRGGRRDSKHGIAGGRNGQLIFFGAGIELRRLPQHDPAHVTGRHLPMNRCRMKLARGFRNVASEPGSFRSNHDSCPKPSGGDTLTIRDGARQLTLALEVLKVPTGVSRHYYAENRISRRAQKTPPWSIGWSTGGSGVNSTGKASPSQTPTNEA